MRGIGLDGGNPPLYSGAMTKRTTRRRRHGPRKKPAESFIDNLLNMLDTAMTTAVCGAGAVLLAKIIGMPGRGLRVEIPASAAPEIQAAWDQLSGFDAANGAETPDAAEGDTGRKPKGKPKAPPRPKIVQLVKGEDGVYRPQGSEEN